ncbi:MAG: response regulator [Ardenticatenaceae bacterium]|nr:response regulator [Ardenticatenaceae bacterium]MCB9446346.1 response regulator [Ardenticatenaceae bacterium]
MADSIRVLIVDDLPETRENVRKLLQFEQDIEVINQAGTGEEAIEMAKADQPDIILMDINMPGIDGIGASQRISELVPRAQIIIMSVQSDSDYLRRAMMAGARDFLTKPFGGDELVAAIRRVYEKRPNIAATPSRRQQTSVGMPIMEEPPEAVAGNIIAVFSPKGGSGCSTVAINLGVSIAKQGYSTALVDGSLQFGDVAVMLNMKPITSVVDLSDHVSELDNELISSVIQKHQSNLNVLLAPPRPEMAEVVTEEKLKDLLNALRDMYDFIIVDTSSTLDSISLSILDVADRIVLVTQQNLPSLKNASRFFDLSESLNYETNKVNLVVNRVSDKKGISVKDISNTLKRPVIMAIPIDDDTVNSAIDQGIPLVTGANKRRPVSTAIIKLAEHMVEDLMSTKAEIRKTENGSDESGGFFKRFFGKK